MEHFHVGKQVLVRILSVKVASLENISAKADIKSVNINTNKDYLRKCKIQGKYTGTVTDIHKDTVFVRLQMGVNDVTHSYYDNRMLGKKDEVAYSLYDIESTTSSIICRASRLALSSKL